MATRSILVVTAVDAMPWLLLRPYLHGLKSAGYEVHVACAPGPYFERLAAEGLHMHAVAMRRSFNPLRHVRPVLQLARLIAGRHFDAINLHSPIGAAVARVAVLLVRRPNVTYVVHGFYFHDGTPPFWRRVFAGIERLLGGLTDGFVFVSEEDRQTAIRLGIVRLWAEAVTIHNGVDLERFLPAPKDAGGLPVIGIVARIVKEKGFREFLAMAKAIQAERPGTRFLVVGDSLPSDRDRFGEAFKREVCDACLEDCFEFTGMTDRVAEQLARMDIFVLPTYREGFPRSIIEAMAAGLPVVTTDVRGCREAVVDGATGIIVPPRDPAALTAAVRQLLADPQRAQAMGRAGRRRTEEHFDSRVATERFTSFIRHQDSTHGAPVPSLAYRAVKTAFDRIAALLLLALAAPVMTGVALLVRLGMGSPVLFRQVRPGLGPRPFVLLKFRTMTTPEQAASRPLADADRLTSFGRLLRATSLDELPQLWNVLRGDMSLVGPRPLLTEYLPLYSARQRLRHAVRPGITGWAQVNGRNELSWNEKLELDAWYVEHCGLRLDLRILAATAWRVVSCAGIARRGHATTPYFRGCADE